MKSSLYAGVLLALATLAPTAQAADVGVSISIGQPGFYGVIDIGDAPRPRVVYPQPVIIETVSVVRAPIYLNVPPGHAKNWGKHCHKYNACARPVYFVENDWYDGEYVNYYRERHHRHDRDHGGGDHHGKQGKGKGHGKHKD